MKFEPDYTTDGDLFGFSLVPDAGPITMEDLYNNPVKALSWKPPYGEMMLHGKEETRTWNTSYRGIVLICLSKAEYNLETITSMSGQPLTDQILAKTIDEEALNGHAIAVGRLVSTRHMTEADEVKTFVKYKGVWTEERKSKKNRDC